MHGQKNIELMKNIFDKDMTVLLQDTKACHQNGGTAAFILNLSNI